MTSFLSIAKNTKSAIAFKVKRWLAGYRSHDILVDFDETWFKNKRVAVIGGADSVLKEPLGAYIDAYDVVVRINNGVAIVGSQKDFAGQRTDFLFHSFFDRPGDKGSSPFTFEIWAENNVGMVIFARNLNANDYEMGNFYDFFRMNPKQKQFSQVTLKQYEEDRKIVSPASPTTGFTAINAIFNCGPKELYLTGITFFKTPHNNAYRDFDKRDMTKVFDLDKAHSADIEYQHVKKLFQMHPSVIHPDKTLKQIFETN